MAPEWLGLVAKGPRIWHWEDLHCSAEKRNPKKAADFPRDPMS